VEERRECQATSRRFNPRDVSRHSNKGMAAVNSASAIARNISRWNLGSCLLELLFYHCPKSMRKCPVRALASASIFCVLALSVAGAGAGAGTGHHVSTAGEMLRPCGSHTHTRHISACANSSGAIQGCAVGGRC